jgi:aminoglycoside phosphotransferase (APT) family kinase protein
MNNLRGHALLLKLDRYLADHIEGFAGPIRIEQSGSRLNPTYVLHTPQKDYVMRARPRPIEREFRVHWALAGSVTPLSKMCLCTDESVIGRAFYVVERV